MSRRDRPRSGLDLVLDADRAEASLWRRFADTRDAILRESLFDRYHRYARSLARRYARRTGAQAHAVQDFEQLAYRGLLEAIDRFNPTVGPPFPAYATPRIAGSIADGASRLDERGAQVRFRRRVERERLASLQDSPDGGSATRQLADLVTELALGLMLQAEQHQQDGEGFAGQPNSGFDNLAWRQTTALLAERVEALPEPERTVVHQHYRNDLLFSQIATMLGLSKGRVSQIHKAALTRLRKSTRFLR